MNVRRRRVGILIPNGPAYFAQVFGGIGAYCRHRSTWEVIAWPYIRYNDHDAVATAAQADGVIAQGSRRWLSLVRKRKFAFVNAEHSRQRLPLLPRVGVDEAAVARLASDHFRQRGLRHAAAVGQLETLPAIERIDAFVNAARDWCATPVQVYWKPYEGSEDASLAPWLTQLSLPVGIFCWNDETAKIVHQQCLLAGLRIPDDVALLGVDNDPAICTFLDPQLSSIDSNAERVGYESAALLDRLMDGQPAPEAPILVPPRGAVRRASTDVLAVDSPSVAGAIRFIQEHAHASLTIDVVLDHLAISRRSLEKQFHRCLGRSPRSEINRVLAERARELLTSTDLSIPEIADRCGYAYPHHFTTMFRKQTGQTPSAYRKKTRLTGHG